MDWKDDQQWDHKIYTSVSGKRTDRYRKGKKRGRKERQQEEPPVQAAQSSPAAQPAGKKKPRPGIKKDKPASPSGVRWYKRKITLAAGAIAVVVLLGGGLFGLWYTGMLEFPSSDVEAVQEVPTDTGSATTQQPALTPLQQEVADMPLEDKVGQMIMAGFEGEGVSEGIAGLIQKKQVGSLILYDRNISSQEQVAGMNNALQALAVQTGHPARLMVAIDQEGGQTRRIDTIGPFYSEPMIAEMGEVAGQVSEQQASSAARDLKSIGINTNLAPVVDVSDGWGSTMDGRSYGDDPAVVADLSVMAVRGYNKATTICAPKHFPGHGSADVDSHEGLAYVDTSRELLDQYELLPFKQVIAEGAPMILVGHLVVPALDPSEVPATLSSTIMAGLLRKEMGFTGVIITDDMEMGAITGSWPVSEASVMAVVAGADMVMVAHTYENQLAVYDALVSAVKSGRISEERIDESVVRILEMKRKYRLEI